MTSISGPPNHPPYFLPQLPPVHPSLIPNSAAAPMPPHALKGPPMAFYPQQPVLFSPPPTPPLGPPIPPLGPPMQLTHAVDVIKEEEYKIVVGREGTTLNGIRSCSQVHV